MRSLGFSRGTRSWGGTVLRAQGCGGSQEWSWWVGAPSGSVTGRIQARLRCHPSTALLSGRTHPRVTLPVSIPKLTGTCVHTGHMSPLSSLPLAPGHSATANQEALRLDNLTPSCCKRQHIPPFHSELKLEKLISLLLCTLLVKLRFSQRANSSSPFLLAADHSVFLCRPNNCHSCLGDFLPPQGLPYLFFFLR